MISGCCSPEAVDATIRPATASTSLTPGAVEMENTHNRCGGTIWPLEAMQAVSALARERGLKVHLDGARLWNAHVATGVALADYAATADSVSVCFSKGLGAPVGSALAGSYDFVERARSNRKRFGGAMRQAGIIAAGAVYALEHNIDRLAEDHQNAATLASYLLQVPGLAIHHPVQTNIVIADVTRLRRAPTKWWRPSRQQGVLCGVASPTRVRFVTHLDVSAEAVKAAGEIAVRVLPGLGLRRGGRMSPAGPAADPHAPYVRLAVVGLIRGGRVARTQVRGARHRPGQAHARRSPLAAAPPHPPVRSVGSARGADGGRRGPRAGGNA